jgi:hypothetical protein
MNFKLWSTNVTVLDNYVQSEVLREHLRVESFIDKTVQGQNKEKLTFAQLELMSMVKTSIVNYCIENDIEYNLLKFCNLQRGCLNKYDESMVSNHLYEPHHDIAEGAYITALYYIDSSYEEGKWCGGELTIYKHMSFVDYPENIINILPKQNRLIIFPGFLNHRVKPYFGDKPRTSLVFGWSVDEPKQVKVLTI